MILRFFCLTLGNEQINYQSYRVNYVSTYIIGNALPYKIYRFTEVS